MTTKEFSNQAYCIDQRINSKLEQIISLHELAAKAMSTLSDMPVNKTESQSKIADVIAKIIVYTIKRVQNPKLQTYLNSGIYVLERWNRLLLKLIIAYSIFLGYMIKH